MDIERGDFIWDWDKEQINVVKHGVDFTTAAKAFLVLRRKIYIDEAHGNAEQRYYCLGLVYGNVLTVRFTYRGNKIRIIGAGFWRKGAEIYDKKSEANWN